jgi:glycine hydroxymethyltransferase
MNLSHGGHLSHALREFFGNLQNRSLRVNRDTKRSTIELAKIAGNKPKMIVVGASAYPRTIDFGKFRAVADEVGAVIMADIAHIAGLVATGLHPSPVPVCEYVTTTTHKTLRGPRGGLVMCKEPYIKVLNSRVFPGMQGGPLMHVIAAKAVALKEALSPEFKAYQEQIVKNARAMAAQLKDEGFRLVSDGTDNHLMLVDLTSKGVTGKEAQEALDRAAITVNKNGIPFDTLGPMVTSGIRIGTPALTTRGMKEPEMREIASLIADVINHINDEPTIKAVAEKVKILCDRFPLYAQRLKG